MSDESKPKQDELKIDGASVAPHEDGDYESCEDEPYCWRCSNTGYLNCYCGGDLCVCENNGERPCPSCNSY